MLRKKQESPDQTEQKSLPDIQQIAAVHGLLRETAVLARQVNFPLNSLMTMYFFAFVTFRVYHDILPIFGIDEELSGPLTYAIATYPVLYKGGKKSADWLAKKFPNGIGFDKQERSSRTIQQRLSSKKETEKLIIELRELIKKQDAQNYYMLALYFMVGVVLPVMLNGGSPRFSLYLEPYGFYFEMDGMVKMEELLGRLSWIPIALLRIVQPIITYHFFARTYSNCKTPKQLENYRKKLALLNYSESEWKMLPSSSKSKVTKSAAIFELDLFSVDHVILDMKQRLSAVQFIIELHRVLLEENFPAFLSDNKIYVGYCDTNDANMRRIKNVLERNLFNAARHEKHYEDILNYLNKFLNFVKDEDKMSWDFYRAMGKNGDIETYYYRNIRSVPKAIRNLYIEFLSQIATDLQVDNEIVTLAQVSDDKQRYETSKKEMKKAIDSSQLVYINTPSVDVKRKEQHKSSKESETQASRSSDRSSRTNPLPEFIEFGDEARFERDEKESSPEDFASRDEYLQAMSRRAYLQHVPWLPEGRVFASVSFPILKVFDSDPEFSSAHILAMLRQGTVHGASKSYKDKTGAVGIQTTDEGYQTMEGRNVKAATFKMKRGNVRIFSHLTKRIPVEEEKETNGKTKERYYNQYRYDGWRPGH